HFFLRLQAVKSVLVRVSTAKLQLSSHCSKYRFSFCVFCTCEFLAKQPLFNSPLKLYCIENQFVCFIMSQKEPRYKFVAWLLYSNLFPARSWFQKLMEREERISKSLKSVII
ncbi:MAG: hypothetical protein D8H91_00655, partial [Alloprevotella sp.]